MKSGHSTTDLMIDISKSGDILHTYHNLLFQRIAVYMHVLTCFHAVTSSSRPFHWQRQVSSGDSVYRLRRTFKAPLKLDGARADLVVMATARSRARHQVVDDAWGRLVAGSAWKDYWFVTKCLVVHARSFTVAVGDS